jgi:sugar (pentulose or hexulose) kinase
MVYETARVLADVARAGVAQRVVLGGGASKGAAFQQLLAAALAPLEVHVLAEEDWAGARGAVAAVRPRAGQARTCRLERPTKDLVVQVERGMARYRTLFAKLYESVAVGGALRFDDGAAPARRRPEIRSQP